jgi:hypothetical protein
MKKIVFLAMILTITSASWAQLPKIGAHAGINLSTITGDMNGIDKGMKFGLTGGIHYNIKLIPFISLQPELNYDQRGINQKYSTTLLGVTTSFDNTLKLNYLTIPVLFRLNPPMLYIEAGPYVGFLLNAKNDMNLSINGTPTISQTTDVKENYSKTEFGLIGGAGLKFGLGPVKFNAGLRYTMGLSNINKDDTYTNKNAVLTLLAGFTLGL